MSSYEPQNGTPQAIYSLGICPVGKSVLFTREDFSFMGGEEYAKFILSRFDFGRLLQEPRLPPLRTLAPN